MRHKNARLFLFPVRRRLMAVTAAWLLGIYSAQICTFPIAAGICMCALLFAAAAVLCLRRRSALLLTALLMFTAGNSVTGFLLAQRDMPTEPKAMIEGTVWAIERENRVYLSDVVIGGTDSTSRRVLVTLMQDQTQQRDAVCIGQRVKGNGRLFAQDEPRNPGSINWRIHALCDGYELTGYILPGWTAEGNPVFSIKEWFRRMRISVLDALDAVFGEHAPFFQGIMLGERDSMDDHLVTAMQLTGTVHILTVSGLHMGMLAAFVAFLLDRTRLGRWPCLLLQTGILCFFACLVDGAAGTQRALIMATLRGVAKCRAKAYEPLTGLSVAALLMTVCSPLTALTSGFQFSFFVVLGLILIGKNVSDWLFRALPDRRLLRRLLSAVSFAIVAQLSAMPMNLLLYGYVPLLSVPMNLLWTCLAPLMMIGGWAILLIWYAAPEAALTAAPVLSFLASAFERFSMAAGTVDGSILRIPAPYAATLLVAAALMCVVSRRIRFGRLRACAASVLTAVIAVCYMTKFLPSPRYVQLDVGQGDAALIRKGRNAVIVDVGPQYSYELIRYLRHEGLLVEAVILSHLDEDHAGALGLLLDSEIGVPEIVIAQGTLEGIENPDGAGVQALMNANDRGIGVRSVKMGDILQYDAARTAVLAPADGIKGSNERSLLLHASVSGRDILMTGDLPANCEPETVPDCDLLKVAHHGSKSATSRHFLDMARPEIALISVGADNSYGHPSQRVLDDLQDIGISVLRTDESGAITVWLDEERIRVETFL